MSSPAEPPETNPAFVAKEEDFTKLPSELAHVDWTKPISWANTSLIHHHMMLSLA